MSCPEGQYLCNGGCTSITSPCPPATPPAAPDAVTNLQLKKPDGDGNYDTSNANFENGDIFDFDDVETGNGGIFAFQYSEVTNCHYSSVFLQKTVELDGEERVFYLKVGDLRDDGSVLFITNGEEITGDPYHPAVGPFDGYETIPFDNPFANGTVDDPSTSNIETYDYESSSPYNLGIGNSSGGQYIHDNISDYYGQDFFSNSEDDGSYYRFMVMGYYLCDDYEVSTTFGIRLTKPGCTDATADNFDSNANVDNETCYFERRGCIDSNACNYGGDYSSGWDVESQTYNPVGVNTCAAGEQIQEDDSLICLSCSYNLQFTEEPEYSAETFGDFETDLTLEIINYELSVYDGTNYSSNFNPYIINTFAWYWTVVDDGGLDITLENYDDGSNPTTGTPNPNIIFNTPDVSEDTEIILGLRAQYSTYPIVPYDFDGDGANDCGITQYWPGPDETVYSEIPLTITNNVVFGCTDSHADTSTYDSAATNDNGTCIYEVGDGVGINGIICKDPNAINYFCNEHPNSYPCTGESFDSTEDGNINGAYNLDYLIRSEVCDCQFNPIPSFTVVNENRVEITEITERGTILLNDTSVAANPTPGLYTANYIAQCGVTMETPIFTITNSDNSSQIELNQIQPSYQVPFFTDPSQIYGGGGQLYITVDVTNVVPNPPSTNSSTSASTTINVIDLDAPIITYPDIYLQGDNGLNIVGITLLSESITDYEFVNLLNNSYYELDRVTPQSFNDGDKIRFDFGTQTFPTAATYTESVTEGVCDTEGNPVCNPTTEQLGLTDVCGDGTCVPNLGWSFTSLSHTTLNPGQGLQIRVQNAGYLRWGVNEQ